jgi:hypothetical protein
MRVPNRVLFASLALALAPLPATADTNFDTGEGPMVMSRAGNRLFVVRPAKGPMSFAGLGPHNAGPRPKQWCAWYMRTRHGGGPEMNTAWNWRHYGKPAAPQVGAIVVWPHHVGEIVGQTAKGQWIVLSGNWGHGVRRHVMSLKGALVRM